MACSTSFVTVKNRSKYNKKKKKNKTEYRLYSVLRSVLHFGFLYGILCPLILFKESMTVCLR